MTQNQQAFLAMISHSEGTDRAPDPYRVCYGYQHTIVSLSDHPAITGEWKGESIANLGPQYAGEVSTAAGKYQINRPTWLNCKVALNLRDFTGPSQDDAALFLIKQKGALDLVNGGQVAAAITLCHGIWASLPGGTSGQPERSFADLIHAYGDAGGAFA
jgi:muramidase (phage lysozyme)